MVPLSLCTDYCILNNAFQSITEQTSKDVHVEINNVTDTKVVYQPLYFQGS